MEEWLTAAAARRPGHVAVEHGGGPLTYSQLDAAAERTARVLAARGVDEGALVATTLAPARAFVELLHALPRLGAVLVPLNPADPVRVEAALTVDRPLDGLEADVELRRSVDPDAVHSIIHTSGTSGRPRPVELSYANHHASAQASAGHLGVADHDRWLGVLPLFHVGGLAVLLRSVIYATTAVVHERFDPVRVRDAFAAGEVTIASLVPTMLTRLREAGLERAAPELRAILLGGGPIPDGLLDWAVAAGLPVSPTYGMTETASQVVTAPPGSAAAARCRASSCGPGATARSWCVGRWWRAGRSRRTAGCTPAIAGTSTRRAASTSTGA